MGTYSASKLFMLLFTIELAKRLRGTQVTVNAVHPGIVRTQMMFQAPGVFKILSYLSLPFSISSQKGAAMSVYLASSPDIEQVSGKYLAGNREKEFKTKFNTEHVRQLLWNTSLKNALGPDWAAFRPDALGRLNEPAIESSNSG
jgi:short-subunit dehydrogenase